MVAPRLAKMFRAAWLGSDAPDGIARMGSADLLKLWRRRDPLIWHARRNDEMIAGVVLRALGWPLRLVFTSAAQRHHKRLTRWLIRQMDAVIATSELSASFLKRESTVGCACRAAASVTRRGCSAAVARWSVRRSCGGWGATPRLRAPSSSVAESPPRRRVSAAFPAAIRGTGAPERRRPSSRSAGS